ncbi:Glycosyl transferase, group 2 family protein [Methanosarcina siciliae HI350]|uniref:Glycosyl transferase, group 2 family protein n=1 Tax=Methanosarcina siciliae HI350 TaxID=1434119 RepID=A0A0E3PHH4_9EURY|nr:glycosyltransferase [Methanosarcina siciliae]AKB33547.1 Glycosyl transferase, group 2 family protein [Methanosarcina siciliae HI350]
MNSDFDLTDLPFDLYTRNYIIKKIIDSVRNDCNNSFKILDAGGRNGNLSSFLNDDEIHIIDIRPGDENNYVIGDVTKAPYKDRSFDIVVSSDVYEHVSASERLNFISELLRVSKDFVILGAPFDSKDVKDAEVKACNYFKEITGEPHPWLLEHIENGLPSKDELENFLKDNDFGYLTIKTNNISNWFLMQLLIFYTSKYKDFMENVSKVHRYYNENFLDLGDLLEPSYRTIYLISKNLGIPELNLKFEYYNDLSKHRTLERLIFEIVEKPISDSTNLIAELSEEIQNKDSYIQGLDNFINEFKEEIQNKDSYIQGLNNYINEFKEEIQNKDSYIQQINTSVEELKKEIRNKDDLISQNRKEMDDIYESTFWKIYLIYRRIINVLLPANTKRRQAFDIGVLGIQTFKMQGFKALFHKMKNQNRIYQKLRKSSVPVIETDIISSNIANSPKVALPLLKTLKGKFTFPANNLNELKFFTATYGRTNSDLELHIINDSRKIIRNSVAKGYEILDNDYTPFKFKPVKDCKGKVFSFELMSKGDPSAAIWFNDSGDLQELTLFYDDKALNGSIGFQACSSLEIEEEYDFWVLKNSLTISKKKKYKAKIKEFSYKPKISIIMPVYNVDKIWLEKAIDSVRNQLYENWELCIADDASTKEHISKTLKEYLNIDCRIKVKYLNNNLGISGASNEALSLATGEFIGLLDNDDELSIDALYEVVKILNKKPETDMVYSDEDKITMEGKRCNPFFKPDWSPDLLLAVNYICHFTVIRKKLVEDIGQFNVGFEGSQDYDLFLRVIEKTNNIEHIPKILYHWRMIPTSTASNIDVKDNAHTNGVKALQNYLTRQRIEGNVVNSLNRTNYLIDYAIKEDSLVSIIIPFKDKVDYLKRCINSIIKNTKEIRYELLLVSNNSIEKETFEYLDSLKKYPNIKIITYDYPFNFAAINNFAAKKTSGTYLLFLNNDTEVITENWLHYMLMNAQREEIGCVGAKLLYPNGTIQHAGVVLGLTGMAGHVFAGFPENQWTNFGLDSWPRNYLAVTAACLMISKEKFNQVGGFDENFKICGNDIDLCLRVYGEGYRNLYIPNVRLYHFESISRGKEIPAGDFQESWKSYKYYLGKGDPFYNPNLTLENTSCSLNKYSKPSFEVNFNQIQNVLLEMGCKIEKKRD